jgi:hypothetical protein
MVEGFGIGIQGVRFRVEGMGFRVLALGLGYGNVIYGSESRD